MTDTLEPTLRPVFEPAAVEQGRERRRRSAESRKQRARVKADGEAQPEAVAKQLSAAALVEAYAAAVIEIRQGFARVRRAELMIDAAFGTSISVQDQWRAVNFSDPEPSISNVERILWGRVVGMLELDRFMSVKASTELHHQLEKGDLPPLTLDNVRTMAEGFRAQFPDMLKAAVHEVFEWLRPSRSRYKTNSELEVPEKVCLESCVEMAFGGGIRPRYWRDPHLNALENVFNALAGNGQSREGYYSRLGQAVRDATSAPVGWVGETDLFAFRAFKNGSLHLTFKRLDLLKRFNMIAGGARLKPAENEAP